MDPQSQTKLARLIRSERIAALGTIHDSVPFVSMVLYVAAPDFTEYYMHISRLAFHTQDILKNPNVSLMITQTDAGTQNPQTLARVSIRSEANAVPTTDAAYESVKAIYLRRFPQSEINFTLNDFGIYRMPVLQARYVAGFARAFDLTPDDFKKLQ